MTEVEATVESEFVPEPKWPERVLVQQNGMVGIFTAVAEFIDEAERHAKKSGHPYRIIRVQPSVERRVSIDWEAVVKEVHGAFNKLKGIGNLGVVAHELRGHVLQELIQRHARIVEVSKP